MRTFLEALRPIAARPWRFATVVGSPRLCVESSFCGKALIEAGIGLEDARVCQHLLQSDLEQSLDRRPANHPAVRKPLPILASLGEDTNV